MRKEEERSMKILVCFKAIYDLEQITPQELCDLRDGKLEISVFSRKIGNYDEAAIENALRIADEVRGTGEEVILHGVTVGEKNERFGKDLYALGFEKITYLQTDKELMYRPELTAEILAEYVKSECGYDMIFMGRQAGMGENSMTHYLLAEALKMPCIVNVQSLEKAEKGIKTVSGCDHITIQRVVTKPAVYAMGEAAHPYCRSVTLREKLRAKGKEIFFAEAEFGEIKMDSPRFEKLVYEFSEKECTIIEGENAEGKARKLWEDYVKRLVIV